MFIIYTSLIDNEIIITTEENEIKTLNKYFTGPLGRDRSTYEITKSEQPAIVFSSDVTWAD